MSRIKIHLFELICARVAAAAGRHPRRKIHSFIPRCIAAITTRKQAQNICSHRPWKIRRKTRMLPIAPSKPITAYNIARISPPMNWLLDPAPAIRLCSSAEPNLCSN